jgi:rhodanese-related sulfurtransferase
MFVKIRLLTALLLVGAWIPSACQTEQLPGIQAEMNGAPYRVVSVSELQTMLENKDFLMVNVHTPFEGNIPQTDLHLPYDEIEQNLSLLPADKDARILIYCLTSGMAKKAVATLTARGYTDIWMLEGGTSAWEEAGLTLEFE